MKAEGKSGGLLRAVRGDDAERWGNDPNAFDPDAVRETIRKVRWLFGERAFFRVSSEGWENVPPAPCMMVMNHSGGTTIPDVWGFGVAWYHAMGVERPIHPLAHEMVFGTKATSEYFSKRGVLRASRGMAHRVLTEFARDLLVLPGGDRDTWRPYSQRWRVRFAGRRGYARTALRAGVPIVPVAHAGAHETLIVLSSGHRLARAMQLHRIARADVFPIHLSLPWGLAIGPWPHLPVPTRLRYLVGAPITAKMAGSEPSEDEVVKLDRKVQARIQSLLDDLKVSPVAPSP